MRRRDFVALTALTPTLAAQPAAPGDDLKVEKLLGRLSRESGPTPVPGAEWLRAVAPGDGLAYTFPAGFLAGKHSLTSDMFLDGNTMAVWTLTLFEPGADGRRFRLTFSALNQCSFRMRMALSVTDQGRWLIDREGAFLKPLVGGDRVDLAKADRLELTLLRHDGNPVRFAMTPLRATSAEVPRLDKPVLPKGPLVDELGQSTLHKWRAKTGSVDELKSRLFAQQRLAREQKWPETFSRWGGYKSRKLGEGTGFFRTHNDGSRWWLVDPDGYAFFSNGPDCVRVDADARVDGIETALTFRPDPSGEFKAIYSERDPERSSAKFVNYLAANFIRAFGPVKWRDHWAEIALAELRRLRFNTVANWSDWQIAAKARFPYVRPMAFRGRSVPMIYRDFPDVYHPEFAADAALYASELKSSAKDPAFIGYFLMNEPTWAFSSELPAAGMLYNTETCRTREQLVAFLKTKYASSAALAAAWKLPVTFEKVARSRFSGVLTPEALEDLRVFSTRMVTDYFQGLSRACKKADPNHLNLGMRWAGVPPEWAVEGMKSFDVFSLNCYMDKLPRANSDKIHALLKMPVMIGEWHFGALDVGLPASGIGRLRNQKDRAAAYRVYLEDAAANPNCVGAHWFTLYDQSALGRFDGENYNIGFLDICNRPYDELSAGAIASHERLFEVCTGKAAPFNEVPEYLPKLFL